VFLDGAIYHVYNRLARGERCFENDEVADAFVELLRDLTQRDGITVFAWALLPTHFHIALRTGAISLDRPMRSLQQRTARRINARLQLFGPLWQGRYRAKMVQDQRYLNQLLGYIHLNPVVAGLVDDPAEYRWSGHNEILGAAARPIVDADEVLRLFGATRAEARAAYVQALKGARDVQWVGELPGRLPWWRLGRPARSELEDPDATGRAGRLEAAERRLLGRPAITAEEYLERAARLLDLDLEALASRRKTSDVVRARELLTVVGVERLGLRVKDIAQCLAKQPATGSFWMMRGIRRRREDPEVATAMEELARAFLLES